MVLQYEARVVHIVNIDDELCIAADEHLGNQVGKILFAWQARVK